MGEATTGAEITNSRGKLYFEHALELFRQPKATLEAIYAREWKGKTIVGVFGGILCEIFVMVACMEYWWFGQLYLYSTLILFGLFIIPALVPPVFSRARRIGGSMVWQSLILLPMAACCVVLIILFRIGLVPYITKYLYNSPYVMSIGLSFMIGALVVKAWARVALRQGNKSVKAVLLEIVAFTIDFALMAGIVLALLNFTDVLAFFIA